MLNKQLKKILIIVSCLIFIFFVCYFIYLLINKKFFKEKMIFFEPKENQTEELVIAVCNEDVSWVDKYASNYKLVTIYNKCGKNIECKSPNIKVIETPNIGSCDYAYLSYVIDRYEDLPDFIEFAKGSSTPKRKYNGCRKCKQDDVDIFGNNIDKSILNFTVNNHVYSNNYNKILSKYQEWVPSVYKNMGEWIKDNEYLNTDMYKKNICNIIYGGHFGTTSQQILKTPKKIWESLRSQQKHPREEIDHFIERTWRPLLCKTNINVFLLCYNENILLPNAVKHYKKYMPSCKIHIYDNESTDNSVELAKSLGCNVISWSSNKIIDDHLFRKIKNTCWKNIEDGWVIVADMDEFLCVTENELLLEEEEGTSILKVLGINMIGESKKVDLSDINLHDIKKYNEHPPENKSLCFLREKIVDMNYSLGAHDCNPVGNIKYSLKKYLNKHMVHLGLEFQINKYTRRYERSEKMRTEGIALHYTNNIQEITDSYMNSLKTSKNLDDNLLHIDINNNNVLQPEDNMIIYAYYNKGDMDDSRAEKNLKFLLKHGNINPKNIVIVCNNQSIPEFIPKNINVLKHENHGYDFEEWYHGLQQIDRKLYKNFIFINSSCIGPFLPIWFSSVNIHWTECFTNLLSDKVKLVGCTINHCGLHHCDLNNPEDTNKKHIQSYLWSTDNTGLDIILDNNILESSNNYDFEGTVVNKEIAMSKLIEEKGYDIKALAMSEMLNIKHGDIHGKDMYFDTTINPLEIIFYKNNRIDTPITKLYEKSIENQL